ncbi:hypothetical protein AGMMS50249_1890 [candidate division SR1 bacterium]|nr:hypothetical protein AGMMS50249_1890 [candidate division SR1 bacterium]
MKKIISYKSAFSFFFSSSLLILGLGGGVSTAQSIPTDYYPNYAIQSDWAKVQENFVFIDAAQKIGDTAKLETKLFQELNASFKKIFPAFPQDYNFKVTYQQCLNLSSDLGAGYDKLRFQSFMTNCYNPLNNLIKQLNAKYTVQANATRSPANGAAPLTVTFDARSSIDPSIETIPSRNYYRYYRDAQGIDRIIGQGDVVNYTFRDSGNYQIHLTVRSSNVGQGILDGEKDLSVNVSPKAANIVVYANQKKLDLNQATKIGTLEAKKGVLLDGSPTMPTGGRKIQSYKWDITGSDGFKFTKNGEGSPTYINVPFNGNGEYKVKLTTIDNENNSVSETFIIIVSDPVAVIKQTPAVGSTSTLFSFDSSASYSLTSRLKLFTWEIFDSLGDKIDTIQGKSIKKQFIKPGNYVVKLTLEDELGQTNVDTMEVYVESSIPTPQFTINSTNKWTQASEFLLNANSTLDPDVINGFDSLEYKREFSSPNSTKIISTEDNNREVVVQFDSLGVQKIKLTVSDMFGKTATLEKQISIDSIIRPEISIIPNAVTRGKTVSFSVETNVPVINYQWNFGDGDTRSNTEKQMQHIYSKVGIYDVSVKVFDVQGNSNTVSSKVFIGEVNFPITAFRVKTEKNLILQTTTTCSYLSGDETIQKPAYSVDRYQSFIVDPSLSVNSKGTNAGLSYFFQPKQGERYERSQLTYKFNELGCQFIDLTLEDRTIGKMDESRIWFNVTNALPTLKNLTLSFPQYGNESGIGFQVGTTQNVLDLTNDSSTSLMVKVSAVSAVDPDGSIANFQWYYYPKDNPAQILETRITPANIPYTFFTLPKIPGEYMFGVKIYDSDNAYQKSESIIGNGPTIYFPQTDNNPSIPIVTLKFDKQTVELGETVTFDVISKIASDSQDFLAHRTIQYDFDGDGERDLITTQDRVTYEYTKPNEQGYSPRAAVIYREFKGVSETKGNTLVVRNGVKPILTFNSFKNIVIFRDLSIGNLIFRQICFDKKLCEAGDRQYLKTHVASTAMSILPDENNPITSNKVFLQKYAGYGDHTVTINLKSNLGVTVEKEYEVKTNSNDTNGKITSGVHLLTIPETSFNNADPEIYVSKQMNNSVLFYLVYEGIGTCFVDTDISVDSDHDGKSDNDVDIPCNTLNLWTYNPQFDSIIGRIYFPQNDSLVFKNFSVSFEEYANDLMDENTEELYRDITRLYNGILDSSIGNADFRKLLDNLRKNLLDKAQTSANIVAIQTHLQESLISLDNEQIMLLDSIIARLSTAETIAVMGGTEYDQAKNEILAGVPSNMREQVSIMFSDFESTTDILDETGKKEKLTAILNFISQNAGENGISKVDLDNFFLVQFCKILNYYNIVSDTCGVQSLTPSIDITLPDVSTGGIPIWLKIILGIVFGGIVIMGGLVVFFAVRAKMKANSEADEEE